jgi:hypothetical protein
VERGEHPLELGPAEPAVGFVEPEVYVIVPVDEAVLKGGKEGEDGYGNDSRGKDEAPQPVDRFAEG